MDSDKAARVHPAFLEVLRQLTPDEARIISLFQHDGPYPVVTVGARYKFGERLSTELRNFNLLGRRPAASFRSGRRSTSTTCAGLGWSSYGRRASPTTRAASARWRITRRSRRRSRASNCARRRWTAATLRAATTTVWSPTSDGRRCTSQRSADNSTKPANTVPSTPGSRPEPIRWKPPGPRHPNRPPSASRFRWRRSVKSGRCSRTAIASRRSCCCRATRPRTSSSGCRRAIRRTWCWACRRASSVRGCAACRPTTRPT